MSELTFNLHSAGILAPGLSELADLYAAAQENHVIDTSVAFKLASPARLPANERRRSSQSVRLVMECIDKVETACPYPIHSMRSVFATNEGVGEISQYMFDALSTTRQVSPLVFPNSVHSATAGYFSIAFQNHQSSTVVSRGSQSFATGLLCAVTEAMTFGEPVLFACFDPVMTTPMDELLPITQPTVSIWIISSGQRMDAALAHFKLTLESNNNSASKLPSWIPVNWLKNCTAHSFAALGLISRNTKKSYLLDCGAQKLKIEVTHRKSL